MFISVNTWFSPARSCNQAPTLDIEGAIPFAIGRLLSTYLGTETAGYKLVPSNEAARRAYITPRHHARTD